METMKRYYFVGIGGSGMSSLAQILRQHGNWVGGSDRCLDRNLNKRFFVKLQRHGISLFPQNENSMPEKIDFLVVSAAIEENNKQLKKARSLKVPAVHRAELLSRLFNSSCGIGIAGTSGKSTVTGMVASIMDAAGMDPTVINGGIIKQYVSRNLIGNAKSGRSDFLVSEVDESDGGIINFSPEIGVIMNISKDHKEISELKDLFQTFASNTSKYLILNGDCLESKKIKAKNAITFGLKSKSVVTADNVESYEKGTRFRVRGTSFLLKVPGVHNLYNALASIAVGIALDIPLDIIKRGIASFRGIKRRLDLVGRKNGIIVIDDFAHNPDKIKASIAALKLMGKRLFIIFQPHGYGPTRFLLKELGSAFSSALRPSDFLLCLDIYDAGGTAERTVTSMDLLNKVRGPNLFYVQERKEAIMIVKKIVRPGDVTAVMGARDDTLSTFARMILREIG